MQIVVSLSRVPDAFAANDDVPLDRRFHNALVEWVLYRAFSKDQDSTTDDAQSVAHLRHFTEILGLAQRADDRYYGKSGLNSHESDRAG